MDTNDVIQWITVGVIILIVVFVIIRKIIRFRRELRQDGPPSCGCGCAGCSRKCDELKDRRSGKRHDR